MKELSQPVSLSLVIPCYNEADRIELLYKGIDDLLKVWQGPLDIVIVDDGSKDNSYELLQQHEVYKNNKEVIRLLTQANTGKGGALKKGVAATHGKYVLTLDADMASPPTELLGWLGLLNGELRPDTIYIGSREHKESVITKKGNRKLAGNVFNLLVRILTPLNLMDTQCGFKLYPAAQAKELFADLQTYGWAHDVEILYHAHLAGMKIIEMPLAWNAIEGSKIRLLRDSVNMILEILQITANTRRRFKKNHK